MQTDMLRLSYTLDSIEAAAARFWQETLGYRVFAFSGEMGAGKTTFIHKLCDHLGVTDAVSSPTFALINEYHFTDGNGVDQLIWHMDWYRLRDSEEAFNAGMEDGIEQARAGNAFCFIEWPEKAAEILQPPYLRINIETTGDGEREMIITPVL